MHRLDLRTIDSIYDGPRCGVGHDEDVDEGYDRPFAGGRGGRMAGVEGADGDHGPGDDQAAVDHGAAAAPFVGENLGDDGAYDVENT